MSEQETGRRLAAALHAEAERVRPEPALPTILARTRRAPAARRWVLPVMAATAAAALVALALFLVGLPDDGRPAQVAGPSQAASPAPVRVYVISPDGHAERRGRGGYLAAEDVTVEGSGDAGLDAVRALLAAQPSDPDYFNEWQLVASGRSDPPVVAPIEPRSVRHDQGVITVDFSGPVDAPYGDSVIVDFIVDNRLFAQQLVWTVQAALDSTDPVEVTMDGEPVDAVLTGNVHQPIERDPYALSPVLLDSPAQGDTVPSPVRVSGTSDTFEANVAWQVLQGKKLVASGTTMGGSYGDRKPFHFTVELAPGDYTVRVYEVSAENGKVVAEDTKDFTVE